MGWLTAIGQMFSGVASVFTWAAQRMGLKNAPDVKAAAIIQQQQDTKDAEAKEIANEDTRAVQDRLSDPDHQP